LHEKSGLFENNSRKGAKRYRVSQGFLLRLASLREEIFFAEGTFRAKPVKPIGRWKHRELRSGNWLEVE
jgi:hypothetical protein